MSTFIFGILAALASPLVMTLGFILWDNHWGGSAFSLNLFKCNLASLGFLVVSVATRSEPFASSIFTAESVGFLMLSSTIGILIGDYLWLEALRLIGARRVIVVDTVKPFFAALLGWALLGEKLRPAAFGGMALTVAGVLVVGLERSAPSSNDNQSVEEPKSRKESIGTARSYSNGELEIVKEEPKTVEPNQQQPHLDHGDPAMQDDIDISMPGVPEPHDIEISAPSRQGSLRERRTNSKLSMRKGYIMSVLNVVLDTYGSVLTKQYGFAMTTWEINLIRFGFAGAVMLLVSLSFAARGYFLVPDKDKRRAEDPPWYTLPARTMTKRSWVHIVIGVSLVTFLTPTLSNYALFQIALALSLTLTSVGPLYALPLSWFLQNDRPSFRACIGAAMAVAGVVILSFFGTLR
jgi:drug/metabolite transporter (DMT)-like permease